MAAIKPGDISVRTVYLVDCRVCCEAVEPDAQDGIGGGFSTMERARQAKKDHIAEHARGEWDRTPEAEEINPYLRYNG
jgi:hypothetical protein